MKEYTYEELLTLDYDIIKDDMNYINRNKLDDINNFTNYLVKIYGYDNTLRQKTLSWCIVMDRDKLINELLKD